MQNEVCASRRTGADRRHNVGMDRVVADAWMAVGRLCAGDYGSRGDLLSLAMCRIRRLRRNLPLRGIFLTASVKPAMRLASRLGLRLPRWRCHLRRPRLTRARTARLAEFLVHLPLLTLAETPPFGAPTPTAFKNSARCSPVVQPMARAARMTGKAHSSIVNVYSLLRISRATSVCISASPPCNNQLQPKRLAWARTVSCISITKRCLGRRWMRSICCRRSGSGPCRPLYEGGPENPRVFAWREPWAGIYALVDGGVWSRNREEPRAGVIALIRKGFPPAERDRVGNCWVLDVRGRRTCQHADARSNRAWKDTLPAEEVASRCPGRRGTS